MIKEYNIKKVGSFRCVEQVLYGGIIHYVFDDRGNYRINLSLYNLLINLGEGKY